MEASVVDDCATSPRRDLSAQRVCQVGIELPSPRQASFPRMGWKPKGLPRRTLPKAANDGVATEPAAGSRQPASSNDQDELESRPPQKQFVSDCRMSLGLWSSTLDGDGPAPPLFPEFQSRSRWKLVADAAAESTARRKSVGDVKDELLWLDPVSARRVSAAKDASAAHQKRSSADGRIEHAVTAEYSPLGCNSFARNIAKRQVYSLARSSLTCGEGDRKPSLCEASKAVTSGTRQVIAKRRISGVFWATSFERKYRDKLRSVCQHALAEGDWERLCHGLEDALVDLSADEQQCEPETDLSNIRTQIVRAHALLKSQQDAGQELTKALDDIKALLACRDMKSLVGKVKYAKAFIGSLQNGCKDLRQEILTMGMPDATPRLNVDDDMAKDANLEEDIKEYRACMDDDMARRAKRALAQDAFSECGQEACALEMEASGASPAIAKGVTKVLLQEAWAMCVDVALEKVDTVASAPGLALCSTIAAFEESPDGRDADTCCLSEDEDYRHVVVCPAVAQDDDSHVALCPAAAQGEDDCHVVVCPAVAQDEDDCHVALCPAAAQGEDDCHVVVCPAVAQDEDDCHVVVCPAVAQGENDCHEDDCNVVACPAPVQDENDCNEVACAAPVQEEPLLLPMPLRVVGSPPQPTVQEELLPPPPLRLAARPRLPAPALDPPQSCKVGMEACKPEEAATALSFPIAKILPPIPPCGSRPGTQRHLCRRWGQVQAQKQRECGRSGAWLRQVSAKTILPRLPPVPNPAALGMQRCAQTLLVVEENVTPFSAGMRKFGKKQAGGTREAVRNAVAPARIWVSP